MLARFLAVAIVFAAPAAAQTSAIRAGNLIDPASGTVSKNQIILVKDGKIVEVGPRVEIPAGAAVIDLAGSWVMPGLMDAHTHLTLGAPGELFLESEYLKNSSALRALKGMRNAGDLLNAGFTAVRDVGNDANYAAIDVRRAIERGWFAGPTMLTAGKIIAPFGGQSHDFAPEAGRFWQFEYLDADTPDEVRRAVRQNLYYGANAIKLVADNSAFTYTEEEIRAAVSEAHRAGITVAVHVIADKPARSAILAGVDSIEHGFELSDETLRLMKEKGTVLVGTDFPLDHLRAMGTGGGILPAPEVTSAAILDRLKRAHGIGVKVAFGTDVVLEFSGRARPQLMLDYLAVWQAAGIAAPAILKGMTTNVAELFHWQNQRGAIAPGQAADIIALPANPLEDLQALCKVHFVMKDGKVIRRP
jgi:imidazolonepropionase-like amidohydrolase